MARVIQNSISIPANSTNNNVLSNLRFENIPDDTVMALLATGSATGLQHEFFVANRAVVELSAVSTANRIPQQEDLILDEIEGTVGDKLQLSVTNTTAGALTYFYRIEFADGVAIGFDDNVMA